MSSKEFILGLSERIGISEEITHRIVKYINKCIGNILESGRGLSIPPLGAFVIEKRMERVVIDPSTQKRMLVPPQNLLKLADSGSTQDGMATIQDVFKELARLTKLPDDVAETIVNSFFGYIQIALKNDDNLDIEGLGHFQMASDAHTMVFTPSKDMSSLINRPFSQFVPVILNDGVFFPDIEQEKPEQPKVEKEEKERANDEGTPEAPQPLAEEQVTPSTPEEKQETVSSDAKTAQEELLPRQDGQPLSEQAQTDLSTEETITTSKPKKFSLWKIASVLLLLTIVVFAVGYLIGKAKHHDDQAEVVETIKNDSVQTPEVTEEKEMKIDLDDVNSRVTYGAYRITGVDTVIVVTKAQSVRNLSATYFGGEQMEMYIRALNGDQEMVEAGDTLMIPHLELK